MEAAGGTSAIDVSDIKVAIEEVIDKLMMQLSCSARVNVRVSRCARAFVGSCRYVGGCVRVGAGVRTDVRRGTSGTSRDVPIFVQFHK